MTKGQFIGIFILLTLLVLGVGAIAGVLAKEHLERSKMRGNRQNKNLQNNPDGTVTDTTTNTNYVVNQDGELTPVSNVN